MKEDFWRLYKTTVFALEQRFSLDFSFAIVTAYNPQGHVVCSGKNMLLDNELQEKISDRGILARSIYGCSPDLSHWEKSWALFTDKQHAYELAIEFNQNAMYWVESDRLVLVPCLLKGQQETEIGRFSERLLTDISLDYFY